MSYWRKYWWPWLGFLLALLMNLWRIGQPPTLTSDEVFFVRDGYDYVQHQEYFDPHPPLGKLQLGSVFAVFGYSPPTWRIINAVMGAALVPLLWWLVWRLTRRRSAAALMVGLALLDGFRLVDSRLGLINIPYVFYGFAALASILKALDSRRPARWLGLAGALIGLALSVKWLAGVLVVPAIGLWFWPGALGQQRNQQSPRPPAWLTVGSLFILPALIYWLTFVWHFTWLGLDHDFWGLNIKILNYHLSVPTNGDPYSQPWWGWLAMWQPFLYGVSQTGQTISTIWSLPNPWLWWTGALIFLGNLITGWRRSATRFLNVVLLTAWLPFVMMPRMMYGYHALAFDLWLIMLLAVVISRWWPRRRRLLVAYLALAVVIFIWFSPWYYNLSLSTAQQQWRRWLPGWEVKSLPAATSATPRPVNSPG